MRIVITGAPRAGKTTLARAFESVLAEGARHTDDLVGVLEWSDASAEVARWMDDSGPWLIEGVAAVRALRKWLAANAHGRPCDLVVWLPAPVVATTPGQDRMAQGCATVWDEVVNQLLDRGVRVLAPPV